MATDGPLDADLHDRDVLARFEVVYTGSDIAADALWWLVHPTEAAPSGTESPQRGLDRLQRDLYRQGVSESERAAHRAAVAAVSQRRARAEEAWAQIRCERTESSLEPRPSRVVSRRSASRRGAHLAFSGALVLLVVTGAVAIADGRQPFGRLLIAPVLATATPVGEPFVAAGSRVFIAPESASAQAALELIGRRTDAESPAARRLLGRATFSQGAGMSVLGHRIALDGTFQYLHDLEAGSRVYVQLLTKRPVDWHWRVVGVSAREPDPHTVVVVEGSADEGRLQEAMLRFPAGVTPIRFEIETDADTPFRWRSITDGSSAAG